MLDSSLMFPCQRRRHWEYKIATVFISTKKNLLGKMNSSHQKGEAFPGFFLRKEKSKTQRKWQTIACSFTSGNHQRTSKRASYCLSLSLCLIKCIFDFALRKTRKGLTFLVTWKRGFLSFLKNILFLVLHSWLEMKAMVYFIVLTNTLIITN